MLGNKREHAIHGTDWAVQLGLLGLGVGALATGIIGLSKGFHSGDILAGALAFTGAGIGLVAFAIRTLQRKSAVARSRPPFRPTGWTPPLFPLGPLSGTPFPMFSGAPAASFQEWNAESILAALGDIDWYQFERFCTALLRINGYEVIRKGGAHPDGGVDLLAERDGDRLFVRCKHWRTRVVKAEVIESMPAAMAEFGAARGAVYTLNGWNRPAAELASSRDITLVNGGELATRALASLTPKQLTEILNPELHHCPSCEAPMVWQDGALRPFWGCSTFPRCRATVKHTGAR